ncbi:MAG: hypothetical protein ACLVC1_05125 [Mediterraneibacter gnavus]
MKLFNPVEREAQLRLQKCYPGTTFVCVNDNPNQDEDGNPIHDNALSVLFDVHQASFVAGALTTLVNENAETLFGTDGYNFTPADNGGRLGWDLYWRNKFKRNYSIFLWISGGVSTTKRKNLE